MELLAGVIIAGLLLLNFHDLVRMIKTVMELTKEAIEEEAFEPHTDTK